MKRNLFSITLLLLLFTNITFASGNAKLTEFVDFNNQICQLNWNATPADFEKIGFFRSRNYEQKGKYYCYLGDNGYTIAYFSRSRQLLYCVFNVPASSDDHKTCRQYMNRALDNNLAFLQKKHSLALQLKQFFSQERLGEKSILCFAVPQKVLIMFTTQRLGSVVLSQLRIYNPHIYHANIDWIKNNLHKF